MALISKEIISETETDLEIKFTSRGGRTKTKSVPKVEGMTNEDLIQRWHRRMTLEYLQRPMSFKREQVTTI
jgi:hypothetical protein